MVNNINNNEKIMIKRNKFNKLKTITTLITATGALCSSLAYGKSTNNDAEVQIVGGSPTAPYSRPYQVALLMNGNQGCGGTLLTSGWVLTAAHCLDNASTSSLSVRVGAHSIHANDGQTINVSQIITHESWRGANGIRSGYDIGLLRLANSADAKYTPAKLPTQFIEDQYAGVGSYATVSGWGLTSHRGSPSDTLREVDLPVISNSSCSSQLQFNIPGSVICGGGTGGVSACNGDSGGPLAVNVNGEYYSIGTVSWGNACRGATAFTRTTSYLDWIKSKIGIDPDEKPVARFSASINDSAVIFNNTSTDDEGIVSHAWNFGDNTQSTVENPSHTYSQDGDYTVTLTVTDTKGQIGTIAKLITIGGDIVYPPGCDGIAAWSASKNYSLNDKVTYKNRKYQAIWWSTGAQPNVYSQVWQDTGACTGNINQAPIAKFTVTTNGLTASFTDVSTDDQGISSYLWDFSDGTTAISANPSHNFLTSGNYLVSLTVTDTQGLTNEYSQLITVDNDTQPGCKEIPTWNINKVYNSGQQVALNGIKYSANHWTQGDDPSQSGQWGPWTNLGACN